MDSNNWYAHFELGVEYLTGGKTEQALALFERANELQPNELRVLSHLAATYFKLNKLVEAENFIMKCLGLDQNHLESAIRLSAIWIRQGHLEKADKLLGKLQSDFRPNYLVYKNSALCAAQMKNPEKSILYFRKALSEFPDVFDCWTDFVFQLLHSGKNTEAFEMIKLALSKVGEEKSLLRLGFEIALRMEAFADAETFIKAYLKQEPADVYAKSHLTTALVYQGKFDEVLTAAEAVFASEPKNFTANFNCALSLYETKNWAKAKNHFELALQVNPNDKNIQEALKQISTYLN